MKNAMVLAAALVLTCSTWATNYGLAGPEGSQYYDVNVVYRLTPDGQAMSSFYGTPVLGTGVTNQSATAGPECLIDGGYGSWSLRSIQNSYATATIELDQVYTLNTITVGYLSPTGSGITYQLRVSSGDGSWSVLPLATPTITAAGIHTIPFAPTDVKFIEYTVWGATTTETQHVMISEISAYVAAAAAPGEELKGVPQREGGYNILKDAAPIASLTNGWQSWSPASWATDGNLHNGAYPNNGVSATDPAEAVWKLDDPAWLTAIQLSMQRSCDVLEVYVAMDDPLGENFGGWGDPLSGLGSVGGKHVFDDPFQAQYIKVVAFSGGGNGLIMELMAFATTEPIPAPEPATMALLAVGGLALLRRRR